jgi:hypothetical protein
MNDAPGYPTQVNELLKGGGCSRTNGVWPGLLTKTVTGISAVEVAAKEAAEAQDLLHAAAEEKRSINRIPKGKAGSGKGKQTIELSGLKTQPLLGAKKAANQTYKEALNDLNQKIFHLENAKKHLENAEQVFREGPFAVILTDLSFL